MDNKNRGIRGLGVVIGNLQAGPRNAITDVPGVKVGHITLDDGEVKTGVTAILPHPGNLFQDKVMAAVHVINGFGKTTGSIQIDELGTIETPIILTNTLSVGVAVDALVRYMLAANADIGLTAGTVNPVVAECNDGYLNDIRGGHVRTEHIFAAIEAAGEHFDQGAVGAGTGMSCFGLKGGIGSASRLLVLNNRAYAVGALVLANFGQLEDLRVDGWPVGEKIAAKLKTEPSPDKGSIIIVLATDIPLSERQLARVAKRAAVGLSRTGSYFGHGSGDIVIAFSSANLVSHYEELDIVTTRMIQEAKINDVFRAAAECTEEAVLNALAFAATTVGRAGHIRRALGDFSDFIGR